MIESSVLTCNNKEKVGFAGIYVGVVGEINSPICEGALPLPSMLSLALPVRN